VDLARLRFGDWVMGIGGIAVLAVMFMDWYEPTVDGAEVLLGSQSLAHNAWQAFAIVDLILALAAVMAIASAVLTALQPTAAVPLALSSLTTLVAIIAFLLVLFRLISPPDLPDGDVFEAGRLTGAWLGFVATAILTAGCLVSIRDERVPAPEHPTEPRLVEP